MQKIIMFTMESCPYCVKARLWMEQQLQEHPEYKDIEMEIIDELEEPELADTFDYYYVPTYYVGGVKVHEGAASKEIVHNVYKAAYEG